MAPPLVHFAPLLAVPFALLVSLSVLARFAPRTVEAIAAALPWFPGKCKILYTHAGDTIDLHTYDGDRLSLTDVVRRSLLPCNLNPFLFNGHIQTFWTAVKYVGPPIHYKRRVFEAEDRAFQGSFAVDFVVAAPPKTGALNDASQQRYQGLLEDPVGIGHNVLPPRTTYFTDDEFGALPSDDRKPLLITLHGLSGGSYEVYLRHVLEHLVKGTPEGGKTGISGGDWEALVVNSRGCAGSLITSSFLYNARTTWDMRQVVRWCRKTWPNRPLFAIGYSIGANMLTNYLAEEGTECLLSAAVVVSNPWNLDVAAAALLRTTLGRRIYSKTMGGQMFSLYRMHIKQITKNKRVIRKVASDAGPDPQLLHRFDRSVQCATWGYPTEGAYYRDAGCADAVLAVRTPLLCVHARDDPIAIDEGVPYEEIKQNPYVAMGATDGGGHLAWFEIGGGRWHWKPAVTFLNIMAREIDFSRKSRPKFPVRTQSELIPPFHYSPMRRKAHSPSMSMD